MNEILLTVTFSRDEKRRKPWKEFAYKVLAQYLHAGGDVLDEAYEYALEYLEPHARVEPSVIRTVLNWGK